MCNSLPGSCVVKRCRQSVKIRRRSIRRSGKIGIDRASVSYGLIALSKSRYICRWSDDERLPDISMLRTRTVHTASLATNTARPRRNLSPPYPGAWAHPRARVVGLEVKSAPVFSTVRRPISRLRRTSSNPWSIRYRISVGQPGAQIVWRLELQQRLGQRG